MRKRHQVQRVGFAEYSRSNSSIYHERYLRRQRKSRLVKGLILALVALIATLVLVAGGWVLSIQQRMGLGIDGALKSVLVNPLTPKEPFYVLLLGTDGRPGEKNYRSDTIVLARVDPKEKKVHLLSIPRDTKVEYEGSTVKINATHTYGGPKATVEAVNKLCGIQISHYIEVNFDGFAGLVDALGGIEVDVPDAINDPKAGPYVINVGTQTLNGGQALTFVRSRAFPDGDYSRMRHQRIFLTALLRRVVSSDPTQIVGVLNSMADMVSTDLSIPDLVGLMNDMRGMDTANNLYSAYVPSEPKMIGGTSYVVADEQKLAQMMDLIKQGKDPHLDTQQSSN